MKVIIRNYQDNWQIIKDNALFTIHKFGGGQYPTSKWKKKILMAEHSPIRSGRLIVEVHDVPSFVIGHFVRHNVGFTPFVSTLRDDRTEYDEGKVPDRLTPNSLRFDGNFQSFKLAPFGQVFGKDLFTVQNENGRLTDLIPMIVAADKIGPVFEANCHFPLGVGLGQNPKKITVFIQGVDPAHAPDIAVLLRHHGTDKSTGHHLLQ